MSVISNFLQVPDSQSTKTFKDGVVSVFLHRVWILLNRLKLQWGARDNKYSKIVFKGLVYPLRWDWTIGIDSSWEKGKFL